MDEVRLDDAAAEQYLRIEDAAGDEMADPAETGNVAVAVGLVAAAGVDVDVVAGVAGVALIAAGVSDVDVDVAVGAAAAVAEDAEVAADDVENDAVPERKVSNNCVL